MRLSENNIVTPLSDDSSDVLPVVRRSTYSHGNRKHRKLIEHLLKFNHREPVTDEHIREYFDYQSRGGKISLDNPMLDCQKWKEWTLTQMVDEAFEFWCDNAGWAIPLVYSIKSDGGLIEYDEHGKMTVNVSRAEDPIMTKAIGKILTGIQEKGMLEFYLEHPATNKDESRLLRMLKHKFGDDFEFEKPEAVAVL